MYCGNSTNLLLSCLSGFLIVNGCITHFFLFKFSVSSFTMTDSAASCAASIVTLQSKKLGIDLCKPQFGVNTSKLWGFRCNISSSSCYPLDCWVRFCCNCVWVCWKCCNCCFKLSRFAGCHSLLLSSASTVETSLGLNIIRLLHVKTKLKTCVFCFLFVKRYQCGYFYTTN